MSKSKEVEAPEKILKYMLDQNRPYSAVDVFNNLHKEFGKTCVQRTLDQLVADGKLVEKVYGKQKVYVIDQSNFPDVDGSELSVLDKEISELQQQLQESQSKCQRLSSELSALNSSLTSEQAKSQLGDLEKETEEMNTQLKKMKSGDRVSPEECKKVTQAHSDAVRHWRKRKRMTNDIVNAILEGYPKSKKQLFEEVGIETDEEYGVTIPT